MGYKLILLIGFLYFPFFQSAFSQNIEDGLVISDHENIFITVEELNSSALEIGLTENRIRSKIEVRLRQVGLKPINTFSQPAFLYVNIIIVERAFSVKLSFSRAVYYWEDSNNTDSHFHQTLANVWDVGSTGIHNGDSEYIINYLDRHLDEFISSYLNAND